MPREAKGPNDAKAMVPWIEAAFLAAEDPEFIRLYVIAKAGAGQAEEAIAEGKAAAEETRRAAFSGDQPAVLKWLEARSKR